MNTLTDGRRQNKGRPRGRRKGTGTSILAPIVDWTPTHEAVVQLSLSNWSNAAIAEQFGYSVGRISQILQDPRAKITKAKILANVQERMGENITSRLTQLADHAADKLRETILSDFTPGGDAKHRQDQVCLAIVKGFLPQINQENTKPAGTGLDSKLAERLISALEKSNEASELHGTIVEGKVIMEDEDAA